MTLPEIPTAALDAADAAANPDREWAGTRVYRHNVAVILAAAWPHLHRTAVEDTGAGPMAGR